MVLSLLESYDYFMFELREVILFFGEVEDIINMGRIGSEFLVIVCFGVRLLYWFFFFCCI